VSSDSDFTRLASRIREQGLDVYGIGQQKTPDAFRKACKRFIFVENILGEAEKDQKSPDAVKGVDKRPMQEARDLIHRAMEGIEQEDDWYSLGQIGQYLTTANPDFDTRTYGKRKLSDLVESLKTLEVKRGPGNQLLVRRSTEGFRRLRRRPEKARPRGPVPGPARPRLRGRRPPRCARPPEFLARMKDKGAVPPGRKIRRGDSAQGRSSRLLRPRGRSRPPAGPSRSRRAP
jgi:hypothetical protein